MSKHLITIPSISDTASIKKALDSEHNAFPVLNTAGNLVGMMPKNILNIITAQKLWYDTRRLSIASRKKPEPAINVNQPSGVNQSLVERLSYRNDASEKFNVDYDELEGGFPQTSKDRLVDVTLFNSKIDG